MSPPVPPSVKLYPLFIESNSLIQNFSRSSKSVRLLQFENEDPLSNCCKERKKRLDEIDKWNGFYDYYQDNYYGDPKEICCKCLSTTFQNYVIDAFNIVRNQ